MMQKRILVAAHMGQWGGNIPGNTAASFDLALRQGADIVELDVTRSADGELFVFHPQTERRRLGLDIDIPVTTGYTAKAAIDAIRYYGGIPVGVCAIFARAKECEGFPVISIFNTDNVLDDYQSCDSTQCPLCKAGIRLDGLVNSFGISAF